MLLPFSESNYVVCSGYCLLLAGFLLDGGGKFLRNVGQNLPDYMALHYRK
jgi:hypothetical protein